MIAFHAVPHLQPDRPEPSWSSQLVFTAGTCRTRQRLDGGLSSTFGFSRPQRTCSPVIATFALPYFSWALRIAFDPSIPAADAPRVIDRADAVLVGLEVALAGAVDLLLDSSITG